MPAALDPLFQFSLQSLLAGILAVLLWRSRRRLALGSAALSIGAVLCLINEWWARSSGANIRIDLLLLIPLVSGAATLLGIAALVRPPLAARLTAAALAGLGGVTFVWFGWSMIQSGRESRRLTEIFDRARQLYWEETIRCQRNLARRFGLLGHKDDPCHGHMVVTSASPGGYPFTRVVANDEGLVYLLYSPERGVEENWILDDRPAARVDRGPDGTLSGEGAGADPVRVEMRAIGPGACEAKVKRGGQISLLTLTRVELSPCEAPVSPPVRFLGAWGNAAPLKDAPQVRRLTQIWLWEANGSARGLLLTDLAQSGTRRDFVFAKQLLGSRRAEGEWELHASGKGKQKAEEAFTFRLANGRARLAGPSGSLGAGGEVNLEQQEVVSHPKIALAPTQDPERFVSYFDNVFFNLNVPWTVP